MLSSALLILAVRRTHVINEPSIWPGAPRVFGSRSSVVKASDRCVEHCRFHSRRNSDFFLCPTLVT